MIKLDLPVVHKFSSEHNSLVRRFVKKNLCPETYYKDVCRDHTKTAYVDIYVAGWPCQPFSCAGQRLGVRDLKRRGLMMFECVDYIHTQGPRAFVLENVAGFMYQHRKDFKKLLEMLRDCYKGYSVTHRIVNTMHHGLPQTRARLYIVGLRSDLDGKLKWPKDMPAAHNINELLLPMDPAMKRDSWTKALHVCALCACCAHTRGTCVCVALIDDACTAPSFSTFPPRRKRGSCRLR